MQVFEMCHHHVLALRQENTQHRSLNRTWKVQHKTYVRTEDGSQLLFANTLRKQLQRYKNPFLPRIMEAAFLVETLDYIKIMMTLVIQMNILMCMSPKLFCIPQTTPSCAGSSPLHQKGIPSIALFNYP